MKQVYAVDVYRITSLALCAGLIGVNTTTALIRDMSLHAHR